jgi:predicted Fe-Mo cluster-binding NifX family protein
MKLCFPVEENNGLNSSVYGHFGSAPGFVTYDTQTEETGFIKNRDADHVHGQCNPASALAGNSVDAIIVGGIGQGAVLKLNAMGIAVLRAKSGVISEDIKNFSNEELEMMIKEGTCSGHVHSCGDH